MPFENRLRHIGEGSTAYLKWKEQVTQLVEGLNTTGSERVRDILKILKQNPAPVNPYKQGTLKYEFWLTGFGNAKLDNPMRLYH